MAGIFLRDSFQLRHYRTQHHDEAGASAEYIGHRLCQKDTVASHMEQIREDEARFPCFTKPQCHTLAMEWMTLAGQCMVQKLQEEQMEQDNQEELSW